MTKELAEREKDPAEQTSHEKPKKAKKHVNFSPTLYYMRSHDVHESTEPQQYRTYQRKG